MRVEKYEFKSIVGFECLYEINEIGITVSLPRNVPHYRGGYSKRKARILSTPIDKYGYKKLTLFKEGKRIYSTVHRQVASTFIPNPNNLPEVNHKDGNKLNNYYKNLEWCTTKYNLKHARENGLMDYKKVSGENCYITKLTNADVRLIRKKLDSGITNKKIEQEYNISKSAVSRIKMNQSFKNI